MSTRDLVVSDEFLNGLDELPPDVQAQTTRALELLAENTAHPSLQAHRIHGAPGKWEAYVNKAYRIIYEPDGNAIRLWRVGDHQIIDRVRNLSFSPHTGFRRLAQEPEAPVDAEEFQIPEEWLQPYEQRPPNNPFANFPIPHLRALGVPAERVRAVRTAPYLEDLETIPGIPDHTLMWMLDLATNPDLESVIFDPGRLFYRTTLDRLEGYCQGEIKRLMLNLSEDQLRFVDLTVDRSLLLRGCAGSGKTTVAIYRAIRHAERDERVIFLTYNKTLSAVAHTLIEELVGPLPHNLEVTHIDAWAVNFLRERGHNVQIASTEARQSYLRQAIHQVGNTHRSSVLDADWSFFAEEIANVIKGNGLTSQLDYLNIDRFGRKSALQPGPRAAVWAVYETYDAQLRKQNQMDWQDVTLAAYRELLMKPLAQSYDHIIIDEAQDMTVMQLRLAQRLNKGSQTSRMRSIFLVSDVSQTLYSRGYTWRQAGLQLQGHSHSLRRNYRNTRQIAEAAAALNAYNRQITLTDEYVDPEFTQRLGPWPIVLETDVTQRERRAVSEKILSLLEDQTFRLSDFAVVCPTRALCDDYQHAFDQMYLPCNVYTEDEFDILAEKVKVLTIHSAKGLEFPVVFVVGLHNGVLPVQLRGGQDENEVELERNRTLLYVGMTRAAEVLYLVTSRENPSSFLDEISGVTRREPYTGEKE